LESLRKALAAMPPGTLVPRDWVLEGLSEDIPGVPTVEAPALPARVDLTIRDLAQLFGKQPSTVRAWVERGDFPGAYKLHGKEWRVPVSAVDSFQNRQRRAKSDTRLSAWRSVRRRQDARKPQQMAERFASWSNFRGRLFFLWPEHILIWYALLAGGATVVLRMHPSRTAVKIAWLTLGLAAAAAMEFGVSSLADAGETFRHLFLFHALTDLTVLLALGGLLAGTLPEILRVRRMRT